MNDNKPKKVSKQYEVIRMNEFSGKGGKTQADVLWVKFSVVSTI